MFAGPGRHEDQAVTGVGTLYCLYAQNRYKNRHEMSDYFLIPTASRTVLLATVQKFCPSDRRVGLGIDGEPSGEQANGEKTANGMDGAGSTSLAANADQGVELNGGKLRSVWSCVELCAGVGDGNC